MAGKDKLMDKQPKVDRKRFPIEQKDCYVSNLQVMNTPAGYYLGRTCWDKENGFEEPYARETDYMTREQAEKALASGQYEVRDCPENDLMYSEGGVPHPKGVPAEEFVPKVTEEQARFKQLSVSADRYLASKKGKKS